MNGSPRQALLDARRLVRTLRSAPDPRRHALTVVAELKRAEGWSGAQRRDIDTAEAWVKGGTSIEGLEAKLRALLAALS